MIPYKQLSLANSKCGRMVYVYPEKDLRAYPGTIRGTEEYLNFFQLRSMKLTCLYLITFLIAIFFF